MALYKNFRIFWESLSGFFTLNFLWGFSERPVLLIGFKGNIGDCLNINRLSSPGQANYPHNWGEVRCAESMSSSDLVHRTFS